MELAGRRTVFFVGGYERKTPDAFFARLAAQAAIFCKTWNVSVTIGPVRTDAGNHTAIADAASHGDGHDVATRLVLLDLDDMVIADNGRPFAVRLGRYIAAFADYVLTGTAFRLFSANWRFGLYFLFPALALAGFFLAGLFVARTVTALGFPLSQFAGILCGLAVTYLAGAWLGRRYFVFHLMDLWSFSREYLRGRRPEMDQRIEGWAQAVASAHLSGEADEILLAGHSTGGGLILPVAARAAELVAGKGEVPRFSIVTLGSTALKFGLHPAASAFRAGLAGLARHREVIWADAQALIDIINFYRVDPFARMGLTHQRSDPFPHVLTVRIRSMLDPGYYRRIRTNFFRIHYQFISANSTRYFHDIYMILFGAVPYARRLAAGREVLGFLGDKP